MHTSQSFSKPIENALMLEQTNLWPGLSVVNKYSLRWRCICWYTV